MYGVPMMKLWSDMMGNSTSYRSWKSGRSIYARNYCDIMSALPLNLMFVFWFVW